VAFPRLNQVKSLSPHHRFVIALHSPVKVTETGLHMCRPEKGRQIDAIRSRAVRSLQSALRTKYYEIRASKPQRNCPTFCREIRKGIRTPGTVSGTVVFKFTGGF
jgi:hypothetical protein